MCRSWSQAFHGTGPSSGAKPADDLAEQQQRAGEVERLAADQRLVGEPARPVYGRAHRAALRDDELAQELARIAGLARDLGRPLAEPHEL